MGYHPRLHSEYPIAAMPIQPDAWARAARPGRRVGHTVEFHPELGSTNDRARAALEEPAGEGRAIVADLQSAGRGRFGRRWLAPAGVNLLVSVGLKPVGLSPERAWWLSAAAALAARDALAPWGSMAVRWPNDLVTADGLKVAGILVETAVDDHQIHEAILGIGVNVNWQRADMPEDIGSVATSLAELAAAPVDRVEVLERVLDRLDREVDGLLSGISPLQRLRSASWLTGRDVEVRTAGSAIRGIVVGLGEDGGLEVRHPGGLATLEWGEVLRVQERAGTAPR